MKPSTAGFPGKNKGAKGEEATVRLGYDFTFAVSTKVAVETGLLTSTPGGT